MMFESFSKSAKEDLEWMKDDLVTYFQMFEATDENGFEFVIVVLCGGNE